MNVPAIDLLSIEGRTVKDIIDLRAQEAPDAPFLIDPNNGDTFSYGELAKKVRAFARHLAAEGYRPEDAIAFALTNGPQSALAILGLFYGGWCATSINLVAGRDVIGYVLEHSEAKLIIAQEATAATVADAQAAVGLAVPVKMLTSTLFELEGGAPETGGAPNLQDDALLMYTSGTTGRPKGVVLTQANLLAGGSATALAHNLQNDDRAMCVLPLYHINGLIVTVMAPLSSGGSVVMPEKFSVSTFWPIIRHNNCSWFSVVPTQISYLLHAEPAEDDEISDKLRFGRSASAPLAPEVQRAFEKRFGVPIIETMGLTETAAQILSNPLPPAQRKIGSPGIAFGNEVIIADTAQREVERGEEGEVLVRGPNVMKHYLKNEIATRESITLEGWLRTGDLGRMDPQGYVFITGRLKELIIKGGENIAPREIDEALYTHPDIIEAAAFACPCSNYGQRVEAAVKLAAGSLLCEQELIAVCKDRVGAFKSPDRIHILDDLPKGPSGKIQRKKLSDMFDALHQREIYPQAK
ncbi:AMP-binding protein [Sulfitobacter aestuarii]|uniref:AMP-binding protein n=1 Tax=Sulfitobacter aestuarii TaxID=2161676 RepID=A0ABW5U931_9RHOB